IVDTKPFDLNGGAACPDTHDAVLGIGTPQGQTFQIIHVGPKRGQATSRTVKFRMRGIHAAKDTYLIGSMVAERSGIWFLMFGSQIDKAALANLAEVECPGYPAHYVKVLVKVDEATGIGTPQLLIDFGYTPPPEDGVVRDRFDWTGEIAPCGPGRLAILQGFQSLAIVDIR
ncbi:MAG TPA: hypothetical protein VKT78_04195, partial [Fimbriimonadaceae bacterium]|nr:hypothetical protein [Fimbriimonadaceae bacterium]